ncbi:MAG: BatD family protein [Candidatus Methanoperedens sp.]|nr:BatD family protein [Candidatus Methanoperedens sp.]
MRKIWIILLVLLMFSGVASAKVEYFYMENNTGLNFMNGYYLIEVIDIKKADFFAIVNLTSDGQSNRYHIRSESSSISTYPWNRINDINASFFTDNSFRMGIDYPDNWSAPVKYTISSATGTKSDSSKVPIIVVTKSVEETDINVGDIIEIKIKTTNTGNETASGVTLTEYMPEGFIRATGSRFPPVVKEKLEPGESDEIYYALEAVKAGTFTIEPTKIEYGTGRKESNSITITVSREVKEKSQLVTEIFIDDNDVMTGDLINMVVKIINNGNASAESVLIEGSVPKGLELEEGDLRQLYKKIESGEYESYSVILKAVDGGNYTVRLKTSYNDDTVGFATSSETISVTKKEKNPVDYWYIILPITGLMVGVVLFTMNRHKEYRY